MKKQTFIAYHVDAYGNRIGFERFTCKRVETAEKHMRAYIGQIDAL